MKRSQLPIIIGKHMRKGIFGFRNKMFGGDGYDIAIVRLSKDYNTGEPFALNDMEGPEIILHFCDRDSLQLTADTINRILKDWKEPEGECHGKHERKVHRRTADKLQELRSATR